MEAPNTYDSEPQSSALNDKINATGLQSYIENGLLFQRKILSLNYTREVKR